MLRRNLKRLTLGAAALTMAMVSASQANAFWGHSSGGSSGGSYGCWGSSGGSYGSYGSWGSSGGSWGGRHWRHHRHAHYYSSGSYGSYGSYGSWGSSGGYYVSYASSGGSSGGSYGSWGSSGGTVIESPAVPMTAPPSTAPAPAPAPGEIPPQAPSASDSARLNSATLNVHVPADAKVFVNGLATKSTGADRHYVSNGLRYGYSYSYEIRAELVRDGRTVSQTKTVKLGAGADTDVTFELNGEEEQVAEQPVNTSLTLHVPADAKVYLSGNETRGNGELRRFSTTKLQAGQQWQDYVVRVEVERNGQALSKEETVSLKGGDARELTFDFDAPQVAQTSLDRQ